MMELLAETEEKADHNRAELNFNFFNIKNQERENNQLGWVKWSHTETIKGGCTEIYLHLIADEGAVLRKAFYQCYFNLISKYKTSDTRKIFQQ